MRGLKRDQVVKIERLTGSRNFVGNGEKFILLYTVLYSVRVGVVVVAQQHYTVRNLVVMAECTCYGHDVDCVRSNSTGSYECVCGGNTTGRYCDVCLPFYNQQPFRYGVPCEGTQ